MTHSVVVSPYAYLYFGRFGEHKDFVRTCNMYKQ